MTARPGLGAPAFHALVGAIAALSCLLAGAAAAQGLPGRAAVPVIAGADTARLHFKPADAAPAPVAMHVLADTVGFGTPFAVAWDLPAGATADAGVPAPGDPRLVPDSPPARPWWRRGGGETGAGRASAEARLAGLPPAPGQRVVAWYRAYAVDSFRLEWNGRTSGPVAVRGRVQDPASAAEVRDPRALPWLTATALLLLPVLAALVAAAWWWRRRRRPAGPVDWSLPEPAWLAAAPSLQRLLEEQLPERGHTRAFLDRLAGEARQFAAAHYGVPAGDLTGRELVAACVALGHAPERAVALARLLDEADLRRYDPETPSADVCRSRLREYLECLAAGRVEPRQTPVPAARKLAAEQAWAVLVAAGRAAGGGGGGA